MIKLIPLGGVDEIGLNITVIEYKKNIIIIDSGLMFPNDYMLGIDYVIPNLNYLKNNKKKILGIILTHAHEDHIGSIHFLIKEFNIPIFGLAYTLEIIKYKLKEKGLLNNCILNYVKINEKIEIGLFDIEFIKVDHSIVDAIGLVICTPIGIIIHTGDFRISQKKNNTNLTNINIFAKYGRKKPLILLSDSTNVEKKGYSSSSNIITKELLKLTHKHKGRIIITLFASNIARIQQLINLAKKINRKILFDGRSLKICINIARKLKYIKIPKHMEIKKNQIRLLKNHEIMIITTGSQGEPTSSLTRIATGIHKNISVNKNDIIILSSKFIPGNEKSISNIINKLCKKGANVIYEKISKVHISGHAFREELKIIINISNPKYFMPIHGEFRHLLLHSKIAIECGIPEKRIIIPKNGNIISINKNNLIVSEQINSGKILIDGKGVGDVEENILNERKNLSKDGIIIVNIIFDKKTDFIIYGPKILSKGVLLKKKTGYLLDDAQCMIWEILEEIPPKISNNINLIKSKIKISLRQYFIYTINRKPILLPILVIL